MLYPIFIIPIEWKLLEKHILSILIVSLFAIIIFIIPYLFGGNVTWIGSSAGVVAVGISLKYGHKISFISMVQNKISISDINCCSWFGYTNVNDIVIFVNYYS